MAPLSRFRGEERILKPDSRIWLQNGYTSRKTCPPCAQDGSGPALPSGEDEQWPPNAGQGFLADDLAILAKPTMPQRCIGAVPARRGQSVRGNSESNGLF